MKHLSAQELSILQAIFGMALLTVVMGGWMSVARDIAMRKAGVKFQELAHTRDIGLRLPSWARRVSDNYNHLFEAPTIFYATGLAIVVGGLADPVYAACAWAYLSFRVLHSLVQATFNRVAVRAVVYGLSWIPLAVMIVRPLLAAREGTLP